MTPETIKGRLRALTERFSKPITLLREISSFDELTMLANRHGSNKGDRARECHHYTRVYSPLFRPMRDKPLRLLEIGLLHFTDDAWDKNPRANRGSASGSRAPSLEMWSAYFPKASIFGFDINDFSNVHIERCRIVRGDMGSRDDLARLVSETGGHFDIIVEDASHASHHQQIALATLFPHLNSRGLYAIEDLHWQPKDMEITGPTTRDFLKRAEMNGSFETPHLTADELSRLAEQIASIAFYDDLGGDVSASRDALAVLQKH